MDSDFKEINTYVSTRLPATYQDFIGFVKPLMSNRQKDKLRKLINFKFDRKTRYKSVSYTHLDVYKRQYR